MYNIKLNSEIETITDNDAAYLFVGALNKTKELNKKVFNAGGGEETTAKYKDILIKVLEIYGLSFKYILTTIFLDKNFYTHKYDDSDKLEELLEFRSDSLHSYYMRLKRTTKNRAIAKILAKPVIFILKKVK